MSTNQGTERYIFNQVAPMSRDERHQLLGQKGCVLWLTGLSGSGKSTLARALEYRLVHAGHVAFALDGDEIRGGLNKDLTFSPEHRSENVRRIAEVARLFAECGIVCITSFISPLRKIRQQAREIVGPERFIEIYLSAGVETCEKRDPKGLYQKARDGKIQNFTGISAPYEPPENPDLTIDTSCTTIEESLAKLITLLNSRQIVA